MLLTPLLRSYFARRLQFAGFDVEDLVQETLIAVHTRRMSYDRSRPLTPWVYAVARHKLIDLFRKSRTHVALEDVEFELIAAGATDEGLAAIDIERLLETLSPKQANTIRDTKLQGLSVAESASLRGMTEGDVKVSVHRGLKALMAKIKP
jgi:RNA polymerase sigma-70 factor (ECF subfamily)